MSREAGAVEGTFDMPPRISTVAAAAPTVPALPEDRPEAGATHNAARLLTWRNALVSVLLFLMGLLSLFSFQLRWHIPIAGVSVNPHFVYQAQAFLHGRWNLAINPATRDLVLLHGKLYTIYPPFPALLLLPFVALFGTSTSDILFTSVCSAINLGLLYLLLEQARALGLTQRLWLKNVVIAILLWFGSINLWLSLGGELWFTAHIVGMTCTLLALILALRRQFTWSAILLGCAFFTRGTLLLAFPLIFFMAWQEDPSDNLFARLWAALRARTLAVSAIPWRRLLGPTIVLAMAALLFAARNLAVFGAPLESGYNIIIAQHYPEVKDGVFSFPYVWPNLLANFFSFPRLIFNGPFDRAPRMDWLNGGYGVSVFVTTPVFLLLFRRNRRLHPLRAALWLTIALFVAAVLLFHATGWYQFGARYLFDAYPFAFLLLALNDGRVDWRFEALGLLGVLVNLQGAGQFWYNH
jgi:hypothetical protein